MDFDDFLKKAMESELNDDTENEEAQAFESGIKGMMGIIGMGSLVKLARVANMRLVAVLKELKEDMNKLDAEIVSDRAELTRKIEKTAKTIDVLNVIISASAITGSATLSGSDSDKDMEKSLDIIIRFMLMH